MKTNNEHGRRLALSIGIYFIAKAVINMIIGGGFNFGDMLFGLAAVCFLYSGLQFVNIAVAIFTGLVVIKHLGNNISNLGNDWRYIIYLAEAVIDVICCALLLTKSEIKQHFTNKWTEIGK